MSDEKIEVLKNIVCLTEWQVVKVERQFGVKQYGPSYLMLKNVKTKGYTGPFDTVEEAEKWLEIKP